MELHEVDALALQARKSGLDGAERRGFDIADAIGLQADLGGNYRLGA
jgi:hypothetical protein